MRINRLIWLRVIIRLIVLIAPSGKNNFGTTSVPSYTHHNTTEHRHEYTARFSLIESRKKSDIQGAIKQEYEAFRSMCRFHKKSVCFPSASPSYFELKEGFVD